MSELIAKNKKVILPAILFFIYVVFVCLTYGKWGHVIADCFREILIPKALLEGKVLYSDITCIYPPLAYQLNALLFKIFGVSLNVLYSAGIICSLMILSLLYKITEKNASSLTAFTVVLSAMGIFTFRVILLNSASWVFPYSYSFLYAFVSCFIAFYLYLLYKEKGVRKYLYWSAFLAGLSLAFKLDFMLFILLILYETVKSKSIKDFLGCFGLYVLPIIFSYFIWFVTGGSLEILHQYKDFLVNFSQAQSVLTFNENVLIQSLSKKAVSFLRMSTIGFVLNIIQIAIISFLMVFSAKKINNKFLKILVVSFIFLVSYIFVLRNIALTQLYTFKLHFNLVLIPYIVLISALGIYTLKYNEKDYTNREKFYFMLALTGFLMSYRVFAAVFISYVGNFIMIIYWLAFLYLLLEMIPEYIPSLKGTLYKKLIALIAILYSLTYSMIYLTKAEEKSFAIRGEKEKYYTTRVYANAFNDVISYINENVPKDAVVLTVDEGTVINYFSGRKTNMKYYALIPHMVDTYGEENIIADLQKNPPDYVLITNNMYPFIGYFGIDYAKKITQYLFDNYDYIHSIKHSDNKECLEFTILKKP